MALSLVESLHAQARNVSQVDIDRMCTVIQESLQSTDKGSDCTPHLRQLFFILQASEVEPRAVKRVHTLVNTEPSLPSQMLVSMVKVIGQGDKGRQCILCKQIINELIPTDNEELWANTFHADPKLSSNYLPFQLLQGRKHGCMAKMIPQAVRWLSTKAEFDVETKCFTFLIAVSTLHKELMSEDDVKLTTDILAERIMNASRYQAQNPYTINPFKKDQSNLVTEIDGTPSRNFFTVLNVGQYYTEDQFLNIYSFSMLYRWLHEHAISGDAAVDMSGIFDSLVSRTVDYSFRLLDQCERKVKVTSDSELQSACLFETVCILDLICKIDSGQTPKIFPEVKRLFTRMAQDAKSSRILLRILQFYLNHSSVVVSDPQQAYELYFGQIVSHSYGDSALAFDTVMFILDNLTTLCEETNILNKYFPNILKILAWNPRTFSSEFVDILPAMMSEVTAMEIFHTLLDLPCMTATMEVLNKTQKGDPSGVSGTEQESGSSLAFRNPLFKPMFNFMIRVTGGQGDTINRLNELHQALHDVIRQPRVIVCAQVVPVLLRVYFSVLLEDGDHDLCNQLVPVILERAGLLYGIQEYVSDVRHILADNLVKMCKKYPQIVVDQYSDFSDYVMTTSDKNIKDREYFLSHLVWIIGEFCSVTHDERCTADTISKYYEVMEALTYEVSTMQFSEAIKDMPFIAKLVSVLMSAIAKLATRCQDLIPRVLLCLTKIVQLHSSTQTQRSHSDVHVILVDRAQELINLLKLPKTISLDSYDQLCMLIEQSALLTIRAHSC